MKNIVMKKTIQSIIAYFFWILILTFWFVIFNIFLGNLIGFFSGIPALIASFLTVSYLKSLSEK